MNISIYSVSSGQILRLCNVPESLVDVQLQDGEAYLPAWFDDDKYYVANGQAVAMPPKPSVHHVFDYATKQWIDPRTPETEWPLVRAKRNKLLQETDWTQLPDVPLENKEAWAAYRQALRDITEQPDPFNIQWPVPPGA